MKRLLEKRLKIYPHESARFIWIAAIFFVIFFVTAIFRTYVDAAFLKRYGPEYVPWMLLINAILTFFVFGIVDRLGRRFVDTNLLSGFLVVYGVSSTILFFMVKADLSISYPILYQLLYLLDAVLLVYLWNIAGDLFDARQGKRIFPLITASQVLGTTLGSFATKPFTMGFGDDSTLLLFGGVSVLTAVFLARTGSKMMVTVEKRVGSAKKVTKRLSEVPGLISQYPMIRYLIVTGLIPNILLPILLYQFSVIANHTFTSQESLISFLSIFRGITTALTFVLLFFMGRLYQSMGLANASLVHPINFSILFAALTGFFNIWAACYGQFTTILIQRAISGPVNKVLFNIIPSDLVVWSRTFIRGTVIKVGMLTGSILMIVLKPVVSAQHLSIVALGFTAYWLFESLIFRKHYKRILKQVIVEKQIDFDQIESVRTFDSGGAAMELGPVSVEDRAQEQIAGDRVATAIDPDVALKLISDDSALTRAEAAASFIITRDIRAVGKLVRCLEDNDEDVRKAAIEALMGYRELILPFLEVSLLEAPPRAKRGILEVIRLSGLKEFEMTPFLGKELSQAYSNLIVIRLLESLNNSISVELLRKHMQEVNEETLSLIFQALWVYHADMRLMYQALKSETASIAVELVENSIQKELAPYLIPLIEDIPLDEKIEKGRRLFPLIRNDNMERVLTFLADSEDPVTRMFALFVIGETLPGSSFVPVIESRMDDRMPYVREIANYAMKRSMNEVTAMPDVTERIQKLKTFGIFEGMGLRELHAIASVITMEHFEPGDIIIREGEENSSIYLIVSGSVRIFKDYGTDEQKEKVTVGEGSFLGELSLFTRLAPNATCVAVKDCKAYVLKHHQFQEIMTIYPQIGINLCRFFTMKLRQSNY
ncbi:MAG: cyclic nucleotide-binding domain-containing protein [Desulfomonile sp.]|jgi:hypothetical protein|nr:cyclic nucleotide-binding domain-containing protein [Deltaproteobacteria bacterium]